MNRVFKKLAFLLDLKGMTISDWVNSIPYPESSESRKVIRIDDLVHGLEKMGIRLEADEKSLLLNFCS